MNGRLVEGLCAILHLLNSESFQATVCRMNEATKTRLMCWNESTLLMLKGRGIDIGCGNDPVIANAIPFDRQHGDANCISKYVDEKFDFVFSSHCLEHMLDPVHAIKEWYSILKPGGHLIITVPDEDLYEQGIFPSAFNSDHKWTFTISKKKSWSNKSINVLELVKLLPKSSLINIELQDLGYDRSMLRHGISRRALWLARKLSFFTQRLESEKIRIILVNFFFALGAVIDQTAIDNKRLAQIQFIVRKNEF